MCLILLAWQAHAQYPLVVAANRDEFFTRPTAAAGFWADAPHLLAGRDLQAGGTWLGVSRSGRFAALTNYREGLKSSAEARSRGELVAQFLRDSVPPEAFLARVAEKATAYNGFNLFVADGESLAYYSNRGGPPRCLAPGLYGLSNHLLDTPWPKLASAKAAFAEALTTLPAQQAFFELLADQEIVGDARLPETGVPLEWERILSAVFVRSANYGTRASTLLQVHRSGHIALIERSFDEGGRPIGEVGETLKVSGNAH